MLITANTVADKPFAKAPWLGSYNPFSLLN